MLQLSVVWFGMKPKTVEGVAYLGDYHLVCYTISKASKVRQHSLLIFTVSHCQSPRKRHTQKHIARTKNSWNKHTMSGNKDTRQDINIFFSLKQAFLLKYKLTMMSLLS